MKRLFVSFLFSLVTGSLPAEEFRPNLGPDLPAITVSVGEVTLLLRRESQWTPGRIDFRGTPLSTERSAYGTVFNFPGVGFVGTGHLENEPENLQSLRFFFNGSALESPQESLEGTSFRLERSSLIREIGLENTIRLENGKLYETAKVRSPYETPLKLVYHFMHAWVPSVSGYVAGVDATGEEFSEKLTDDDSAHRQFHLRRPIDWIAVYEPGSRKFAVSRLLAAPPELKTTSKLWNVVGTYRKYYLESALNETLPAGFHGTWSMVTAFGEGEPETWQEEARKLAIELASEEK
ncbi:MAG: hypothetical protein AAF733_06990 [Verrucomicrobiota bacterium]